MNFEIERVFVGITIMGEDQLLEIWSEDGLQVNISFYGQVVERGSGTDSC